MNSYEYVIFLFVFQARLDQLNADQMRSCLDKVIAHLPGMINDIIDSMDPPLVPGNPAPNPGPQGVPSWCSCHKCRNMPTAEEMVCCGHTPDACTSCLPVSDNLHLIL